MMAASMKRHAITYRVQTLCLPPRSEWFLPLAWTRGREPRLAGRSNLAAAFARKDIVTVHRTVQILVHDSASHNGRWQRWQQLRRRRTMASEWEGLSWASCKKPQQWDAQGEPATAGRSSSKPQRRSGSWEGSEASRQGVCDGVGRCWDARESMVPSLWRENDGLG